MDTSKQCTATLRWDHDSQSNDAESWTQGREMCLHAAISDEFGVGAERARDGKGRRAANSVEAEFGIAKTSESFGHSHFRNVSAWEMEEVRWGGGFVSNTRCYCAETMQEDALLRDDYIATDALEVINSSSKIWAGSNQIDGFDSFQFAELDDSLADHAVCGILNNDITGFERDKILEHAVPVKKMNWTCDGVGKNSVTYAEQGFTDNTAEYSMGMSEATGRKALSSATAWLRQVPKPERAGITRCPTLSLAPAPTASTTATPSRPAK